MSRSEGTGRGVDVGTAGLGCSTTTVGVAVGSAEAVGVVSPAWQAIRDTDAAQAIAPAIMVDCRIVLQSAREVGKPRGEESCIQVRVGVSRLETCARMPNLRLRKLPAIRDRDDIDNNLRRY